MVWREQLQGLQHGGGRMRCGPAATAVSPEIVVLQQMRGPACCFHLLSLVTGGAQLCSLCSSVVGTSGSQRAVFGSLLSLVGLWVLFFAFGVCLDILHRSLSSDVFSERFLPICGFSSGSPKCIFHE